MVARRPACATPAVQQPLRDKRRCIPIYVVGNMVLRHLLPGAISTISRRQRQGWRGISVRRAAVNRQRGIQWLYEELPTLLSAGVLSTETATRLQQYYGTVQVHSGGRWCS